MRKSTNININNQRANRSAAELSSEDGRSTCVPANIPVPGGGPFRGFGYDRPDRSPERIAKAQAFIDRLKQYRQDPARCPRCGRPRGDKFRTCDLCREKVRKAKLRAKGIAVVKGGEYSNADLAAMVIQMRREIDRMQARFKLWQKAANYRSALKYRTDRMRKKFYQPAAHAEAMDYLSTTNHAFENTDEHDD